MGNTYSGLTGKSKADFGHGEARYITYMNVFSNPISDPMQVESVEIDPRQNEVRAGDALFTTSSETPEEVGMSSLVTVDRPNTYLNSFCFGYRVHAPLDTHFLAYLFRSQVFREKMTYLAQGISRYNISKNRVMQVKVLIPVLDEQVNVGVYFERLEKIITLHQRKDFRGNPSCILHISVAYSILVFK